MNNDGLKLEVDSAMCGVLTVAALSGHAGVSSGNLNDPTGGRPYAFDQSWEGLDFLR